MCRKVSADPLLSSYRPIWLIHSLRDPRFKGMQDCFRKHPDIYGEEIDDDEPESDESPLNTTEVAISTDGHDGKVPKSPVSEPPAHSPIPAQTPENNPSKGEQRRYQFAAKM